MGMSEKKAIDRLLGITEDLVDSVGKLKNRQLRLAGMVQELNSCISRNELDLLEAKSDRRRLAEENEQLRKRLERLEDTVYPNAM